MDDTAYRKRLMYAQLMAQRRAWTEKARMMPPEQARMHMLAVARFVNERLQQIGRM